jgi:curved DNA-binding protein CbpA
VTHYKEADYYELLEVPPDALPTEIEDAYRRQMELLSGDSMATYGLFVADDLVHFRQRVEEAHRVLCDPARRRAYDAALGLAPEPVEAPAEAPAEPLVARQAAAGEMTAAPAVAMAGPPEGDAASAPAAAPVPAAAPAPQVPEEAALPPFGPSGPPAAPSTGVEPAEPEADGTDGFDGPTMRGQREAKGISLASISAKTRIAEYYLESIECERFAALPPPIYLRSYVRQYAAAIGLEADRAVESFLARYNDARNEK